MTPGCCHTLFSDPHVYLRVTICIKMGVLGERCQRRSETRLKIHEVCLAVKGPYGQLAMRRAGRGEDVYGETLDTPHQAHLHLPAPLHCPLPSGHALPPSCPSCTQTLVILNSRCLCPGGHKRPILVKDIRGGIRPPEDGTALCALTVTPAFRVAL